MDQIVRRIFDRILVEDAELLEALSDRDAETIAKALDEPAEVIPGLADLLQRHTAWDDECSSRFHHRDNPRLNPSTQEEP